MKQLTCRIIQRFPHGDLGYGVFDGDQLVSSGVSSSEGWVKHDAGGYHTKKKFDQMYPDGWNVNFEGF